MCAIPHRKQTAASRTDSVINVFRISIAPSARSGWPSALVEAARQALLAPFLVDKGRLTALLTQVADLLSPVTIHYGLVRYGLVRERLHLADVLGEGAGEGVWEREDLGGAEACRLAAADPRE